MELRYTLHVHARWSVPQFRFNADHLECLNECHFLYGVDRKLTRPGLVLACVTVIISHVT